MPCFYPLTAYYSRNVNPSGKRSLVFSSLRAQWADKPLEIACGQCSGCRLERSRQWAVRCMHEADLNGNNNCFLTLTFDDEHLYKRDNPFTVDVRDFQLFMKRLRKKYGKGIRFYHCGEYGEVCRACGLSSHYCSCRKFHASIGRPHYHALLFGFNFPDRELFKVTPQGNRLYTSPSLSKLWPNGLAVIGDVTFESAAYVARYVMKKMNGDKVQEVDQFGLRHYERMCLLTGLVYECAPEYITMSRRPGIGKKWYDQFESDVFPHDYVVVNGVKCRPPKYYFSQLEEECPQLYDEIKLKRIRKIYKNEIEGLQEHGRMYKVFKSKRLDDARRNHEARMKLLTRKL